MDTPPSRLAEADKQVRIAQEFLDPSSPVVADLEEISEAIERAIADLGEPSRKPVQAGTGADASNRRRESPRARGALDGPGEE